MHSAVLHSPQAPGAPGADVLDTYEIAINRLRILVARGPPSPAASVDFVGSELRTFPRPLYGHFGLRRLYSPMAHPSGSPGSPGLIAPHFDGTFGGADPPPPPGVSIAPWGPE